VYLEITQGCDSFCRLCDYWRLRDPDRLTVDRFDAAVLPLLARYMPLDNITITGGEPTLHPDLGAVCERLRPLTRSLTLVTSTTHLEDHYDDVKNQLTSYLISLDSVDPLTYRRIRGVDLAQSVLRWIRRIRDTSDARVAVNCVIQRANHDQIFDVFFTATSSAEEAYGRQEGTPLRTERAARLTVDELAFVEEQLCMLVEHVDEDRLPTVRRYPELLDLLAGGPAWQGRSCDVPWTSFVINAHEDVLPCFYLPFRESVANPDGVRRLIGEVRRSMLDDPDFRARHCDRCPCFMSRRRPLEEIRRMDRAGAHDSLRHLPAWGHNEPSGVTG
jgi:MoaA/NifB/PqqE/SkfB family radical SAM enzyme